MSDSEAAAMTQPRHPAAVADWWERVDTWASTAQAPPARVARKPKALARPVAPRPRRKRPVAA